MRGCVEPELPRSWGCAGIGGEGAWHQCEMSSQHSACEPRDQMQCSLSHMMGTTGQCPDAKCVVHSKHTKQTTAHSVHT